MLRNAARSFLPFFFGLTLVAQAAFGAPPPQLTILKVHANGLDGLNPSMAIEGSNFGQTPAVFMGAPGGLLVQLNVLSSSNNFISAQLNGATSAPGTYLLVVTKGPSQTDVFTMPVTIGAVGPPGPEGRAGPPGSPGLPGSAGLTG